MQPVVHLAVGYICYAAYARWELGERPAESAAAVAVFGAALPDLLDKPLWLAGVVDVGRTVGHSLLFAVPLVAAVWLLARSRGRAALGVAFAIGYLSHVATDIPWHVLSGDYHELGFLLWPITPMPEYTGTKSLGRVAGFEVTTLWLEAVILVAGVALWWRDGRPGLEPIRRGIGRVRP
ncbi:metal-dependent hydrolase [Natrarchaeobius oligotrophus]|uniref:Metal-dependent hydrolase n=1 Tax=Natrarchaeobius chitinivorans TaxID=1679083 RepID=A0A3N6PGX7_NATCH|nr:metal-dependent hydrolase [Natrarchaeobius chitinivorans]RQG99649.1 metal-dependent hydrolase [Natrarchaeobius chitinivorans]